MRQVESFLRECVQIGGSDLHFKTDTGKAYIRVHGDLREVEADPFTNEEFRAELFRVLRPAQIERFERHMELDFALEVQGVSRFRGNAYQQRGNTQAAFRVIPYDIQSMEDLQLPPACYDFIERPRGLVLVTGPAGSGKSTTLAGMLDRINRTQPAHIVTVEDPIEFVHDDHMALINQRELDIDTLSFANALKYVLRQDPDVILVGEMRDLETIHLAITAAETGHLVFGTLHTVDAIQTVDRIVDVFPIHQQQQIRMQLSVNLVGVVSQTLVRRRDGRGRIAAHEVMVANSAVRNLIRENKTYQIGSLIQTGMRAKMINLDHALANLVERDLVTKEDAKERAKDPGEFERLVALDAKNKMPAPGQTPPPQAPGARPGTPPPPANGRPTPGAPPVHRPVSGGAAHQPNRPSYRRD
ncbi:MAG: PilT/PilU family type 4a pilus ATPase [Fimbriimonas sp.]